MPTDNPKISLYVPQQIYDRFKSFQEERKLSMSQAGIVVLAEYFGIEETIKEITEGTTIGGVTLAEFEQLKQQLKELTERVNVNRSIIDKLSDISKVKNVDQNKSTGKLPLKNQTIDRLITNKPNALAEQKQDQLELIEENIKSISVELLAKRLGVKNSKTIGNKKSEVYKNNNPNAEKDFYEWTRNKDFDAIGWKPIREGKKISYIPIGELSKELLSRLRNWISKNK